MRDARHELALRPKHRVDPVRHRVEGLGGLAELGGPLVGQAVIQLAGRHALHRVTRGLERSQRSADQEVSDPEDAEADQHEEQAHPAPGPFEIELVRDDHPPDGGLDADHVPGTGSKHHVVSEHLLAHPGLGVALRPRGRTGRDVDAHTHPLGEALRILSALDLFGDVYGGLHVVLEDLSREGLQDRPAGHEPPEEDGDAHEPGDAECDRAAKAHSGFFGTVYPTPRTVFRSRGFRASSPSFLRRREMCTSTLRSKLA